MLHDPIQGFKPVAYPQGDITQFFGENPQLYATVCGAPNLCLTGGHNGIDIVRSYGTPIMCVESGKVVEVKSEPNGYGEHIRVLTNENEWVYGHLSRIDITIGQTVNAGDQIGLMGNTGFVVSGPTPYWKYNPYAGTHLHLGRRPCRAFVEGTDTSWDLSYATGDRAILTSQYTNGFLGSTDFISEYTSQVPQKYLFTNNLYFGLSNSDVRELQSRLGVFQTGFFGPLTFFAVRTYQKANNIPATGFVGPLTRASLNAS